MIRLGWLLTVFGALCLATGILSHNLGFIGMSIGFGLSAIVVFQWPTSGGSTDE